MKKQGFLRSSAILIVSVILAKAAGAVFRIPLANMLGGTGMAYFGGAYGIFLPVYAVFVTGLSSAAARLTAEYNALYGYEGVLRIKKCSLALFSLTGIAGTLIMFIFAKPFAVYAAGSREIYLSVMVIAPSVLFSCITAAYRGVAEGQRNMYPTAVSQTAESFVKMAAGLAICMAVINNSEYFAGIFSCVTDDPYSVSAAGATAGVTLSSFAGMLYMMADDIFSRKPEKTEGFIRCSESRKVIFRKIIISVIPFAFSALLSNLTSLIDLCTIMRYINISVKTVPEYFLEKYDFTDMSCLDSFSEFAYGSYCGMAVTVFNLVPSFTNMFGKSIFPAVADACARNDRRSVTENAEKVLKITALVAVPAGLGIFVLADRILGFLFPSSVNETAFCVNSLRFLGIAVIFLCISYPVFSMLQASGKADIPVKIMAAALVIKTAGNIIFVRIPSLNAAGAALATLLCYIFIFISSLAAFVRCCDIRTNLLKLFITPVYSGIMCMAAAWLSECISEKYFENTAVLFISVLSGAGVYFLTVYLTGEMHYIKKMFGKENISI